MVTCYFYKNILLFLLIKLNSNLYKLKSFYFITTNFTDIFSVCLQIGSFISIQCLILLSVYHFITFITPGLFKFEYKLLKLIIVVCCLLFCISIIFFHLFFLPFLCDFFLMFQQKCGVTIFFESRITEYFVFYKEVYFIIILVGQVFAIILLNVILINKKIDFIHKYRKVFYFSFILISTLITPPDVISQVLIGTGFIVFYELIVLIIFLVKYTLINKISNF